MMLLTFLLAGRSLDQNMRRRTRAVAGNLAALKAETAIKLAANGDLREVPIGSVQPGDIVLVRSGERIAVDGVVVEGASEIDQSLVTGETTRATVGKGTLVYAGTMNGYGTLRVRVEASAEATFLDDVTRLLEKAVEARSRYLRLAFSRELELTLHRALGHLMSTRHTPESKPPRSDCSVPCFRLESCD
jgi:Cu2+-exporting ATPase